MDNNSVVLIITFSVLMMMSSHTSAVDSGAIEYPPAIGDLRLVPYSDPDGLLRDFYEVLVYYSDGIDKPDWGGICSEYSTKEVGKVICQQLGYSSVDIAEKTINTNIPIWIRRAQCDTGDESHILRCKNDIVHGAQRTNVNTCNGRERILVKCDFNEVKETYDGEIRLCPPDNVSLTSSINKTSVSFGAVQMFLSYRGGEWRGINQNKSSSDAFLGSAEADAICRQMGYTGAIPGSAVTLNASGYMFKHCFSRSIHHNAWLTTDKDAIKCTGTQKCFGCCYRDPTVDCQNCDTLHNIVIRCGFDISKAAESEGGTLKDCTVDRTTLHCDEASVQEETSCEKKILIPLATLLPLSILINIALAFGIIIWRWHGPIGGCLRGCCHRCGGYRNPENNN